jgi:hypothetical protein
MAAFHVTLLATLYNMSFLVHKIYFYQLVESIGIYYSQSLFIVMALGFLSLFGKQIK